MGCGMGTICAPSNANIVIANFEAKHIYPYIKEMSLLYIRYIDDIFMTWRGAKSELTTFIKELNENHKTIILNFKFHKEKLHFLTQCCKKTKITTSKQLYIANLLINKHSYTLNQSTQDL